MGVPDKIMRLGVFSASNIREVLLFADLSRWPVEVLFSIKYMIPTSLRTFITDDKSYRRAMIRSVPTFLDIRKENIHATTKIVAR